MQDKKPTRTNFRRQKPSNGVGVSEVHDATGSHGGEPTVPTGEAGSIYDTDTAKWDLDSATYADSSDVLRNSEEAPDDVEAAQWTDAAADALRKDIEHMRHEAQTKDAEIARLQQVRSFASSSRLPGSSHASHVGTCSVQEVLAALQPSPLKDSRLLHSPIHACHRS